MSSRFFSRSNNRAITLNASSVRESSSATRAFIRTRITVGSALPMGVLQSQGAQHLAFDDLHGAMGQRPHQRMVHASS
jgi:nicotinic acid mononucleotide adenylyltransferase